MDFFQAQESARSRSRTLVFLFIAAVVAIIVTIYAVVHIAVGPGLAGGIDLGLLAIVAFGTTLLVTAGSAFRTLQLRQGGSKVAEMLGGRRVKPNTTDEAERRLVNVIEEMAIASGTSVPAIYVMDHEQGINAFAAGYTPDDAAIAVTRGTIAHLTRDELQGVIAHEFSHVLNGDMRLNIRLIGLLFGILLLAVVGRVVIYGGHGGRGRREGGGQAALIGIALIVVGYVGVFFGKLIQAAVSRQREYLADAAAVQFTRNPDGIAGALKKIGGAGSRLTSPHAQEASHLFFATGLQRSIVGLLSTHPPLPDRIRRIDPAFDGRFPKLPPADAAFLAGGALEGAEHEGIAGFAGAAVETRGATAATMETASSGAALMASIGAPQPEHVDYASRLMRSVPDEVRDAAHDTDGAIALLFALLLHEGGPAAGAQRDAIRVFGGDGLPPRVQELARLTQPLGPAARLPLLDVLLPALRGGELSPDQARRVHRTAQAMVAADGRMDMFELAMLHVLRRQLTVTEPSAEAAERVSEVHSLAPLRPQIEAVLTALAWSGTEDGVTATEAFTAGAASLPELGGRLTIRARGVASLEEIDDALGRLRTAAPAVRRRIITACVHTVAHDDLIDIEEAELLRAVAEALDAPMPPVLRAPGAAPIRAAAP